MYISHAAHIAHVAHVALPALAALLISTLSMAQQPYPNKPIRLIVPAAPGGGQDIVARALANKLTEHLGQPMVIDNRGGSGGNVGADIARLAAPDGYTITLMSISGVVRPLLYATDYEVLRDFQPVSQVSTSPYALAINPGVPARTLGEFIAHAKSNPGKLNYSSSGAGGLIHLGCELFNIAAGIKTIHVPYKGTGAAYPDLIAGQIHWTLANITSALPHVRTQRLRILAVSSLTRAKAQPDVPTIAEAGAPGFEVTQWYGMLVRSGAPARVVERLAGGIQWAMKDTEFSRRLAADGTETVSSSPKHFYDLIKTESAKWARVIKQTGVRVE